MPQGRALRALSRFYVRSLITLYSRPARPHCAQEEGEPHGSPCLLRITTPSFRARFARKGKYSFPAAARLPYQGKRNGCRPRARARNARPYDGLNGASPWGGICPSCCFGQMGGGNLGVTHLARVARPYLRQQMPQLFGYAPMRLLPPKGNGVIRKRGETSCLPSCARGGRAGRIFIRNMRALPHALERILLRG